MTVTLYDATIPVCIRALENLAHLLTKGQTWADEQGVAHFELLDARLIEDMGALPSQIQRASDAAKFAGARLGQIEAPAMPDTETTFDELQARIAATIAFLRTVPASAIDGREDADIELKFPQGTHIFTGRDYAFKFVLPNVFFHVTTAYALLRMKGVPVGKMDYIGAS